VASWTAQVRFRVPTRLGESVPGESGYPDRTTNLDPNGLGTDAYGNRLPR
jgi:hypothetical protein